MKRALFDFAVVVVCAVALMYHFILGVAHHDTYHVALAAVFAVIVFRQPS